MIQIVAMPSCIVAAAAETIVQAGRAALGTTAALVDDAEEAAAGALKQVHFTSQCHSVGVCHHAMCLTSKRTTKQALEAVDAMYADVASNWLASDTALASKQRGFLERAAEIYQRMSGLKDAEDPDLDQVLAALNSRAAERPSDP